MTTPARIPASLFDKMCAFAAAAAALEEEWQKNLDSPDPVFLTDAYPFFPDDRGVGSFDTVLARIIEWKDAHAPNDAR